MSQDRRPPGTPAGGQFAAGSRPRAHLSLVPDLPEAAQTLEPEPTQPDLGSETRPVSAPLTDVPRTSTDGQYVTVVGSKYSGQWRDAAAISKDVRADIRAAQKSGALPTTTPGGEKLTFSVTTDKYSMGQAVNIAIKGLSYDEIYGPLRSNGKRSRRYSQATRELVTRLESMSRAYDKSTDDAVTDYHHGNHFTSVTVETPASAAYDRMSRAKDTATKAMQEAAAELAPLAAKAGLVVREISVLDVTSDPRTVNTLTSNEQFATIAAQEKARVALSDYEQAKAHYLLLRTAEENFDDDDFDR